MRALILVDLQYDFCPGGAVEVRRGDEVIPVANRILPHFSIIAATQEWHPRDHTSFAANHPGKHPYETIDVHGTPKLLLPPHCVQSTHGADFHATLDHTRISGVFRKGMDPAVDSHSGFFDQTPHSLSGSAAHPGAAGVFNGNRRDTGLAEWLSARWIKQVYVMGLATDGCVKNTAIDARSLGFDVWVIEDGCRAFDRTPGSGDRALSEMRGHGCAIVDSGAIDP